MWAGRPGEEVACGAEKAVPVPGPVACGSHEGHGWTGGPVGKVDIGVGGWSPSRVVASGLTKL